MVFSLIGLFVSCGTVGIVYDDTIPAEETAIIQPSVEVYINSFNNNDVHWAPGFWKGTKITVPSGEQNLTLGVSAQRGYYTYSGGKFSFTYRFEPGHFYFFRLIDVVSAAEIIVSVDDKTTGAKVRINAKAFPFNF
jgi:hypothetical protein